jgi:choline dehydrogenase-like flavoprotein
VKSDYDYIIIGAGSTGVYLATQLAKKGKKIKVIDSCSHTILPFFKKLPIMAGSLLQNQKYSKIIQTSHQKNILNRSIPMFKSNLLGGLAEMNGAVCFKGHKKLYENAFSKSFNKKNKIVNKIYNTKNRELVNFYNSRTKSNKTKITNFFINFWNVKSNVNFDKNLIGSGYIKNNSYKSLRKTFLKEFIEMVRNGKINLNINTNCNKIILKKGKPEKLIINQNKILNCRSSKIVLCAGVVGSCEILLRSGIGDKKVLIKNRIKPTIDLPSVGKNLSDHPNIRLPFFSKVFKEDSLSISFLKKSILLLKALIGKDTVLNGSGASAAVNIDIGKKGRINDIVRIQLVHFSLKKNNDRRIFKLDKKNNFSLSVSLIYPYSVGSIFLKKNKIVVNPQYLDSSKDMKNLLAGIKLAQKFINEISDSPMNLEFKNKNFLKNYIKKNVSTGYHMIGSCSMGSSYKTNVCNEDLSVKKTKNLFICDSSVLPGQISSNTYYPCLLLADYFVNNQN